MSIISERQAHQLRALFAEQARERVTITLFTRQAEPGAEATDAIARACDDASALLTEVVSLAPDYLALEMRDLAADVAEARALGIERVLALVLRGQVAGHVRTFGVPADYEFTTLIDDLLDLLAGGHTALSERTRNALALLRRPVHLQVFEAPTWPVCSHVARLAHQLAILSPLVTADAIDASLFPGLVRRYQIYSTPALVIDDHEPIFGFLGEADLVQRMLNIAGPRPFEEAWAEVAPTLRACYPEWTRAEPTSITERVAWKLVAQLLSGAFRNMLQGVRWMGAAAR